MVFELCCWTMSDFCCTMGLWNPWLDYQIWRKSAFVPKHFLTKLFHYSNFISSWCLLWHVNRMVFSAGDHFTRVIPDRFCDKTWSMPRSSPQTLVSMLVWYSMKIFLLAVIGTSTYWPPGDYSVGASLYYWWCGGCSWICLAKRAHNSGITDSVCYDTFSHFNAPSRVARHYSVFNLCAVEHVLEAGISKSKVSSWIQGNKG